MHLAIEMRAFSFLQHTSSLTKIQNHYYYDTT